MKNPFPNRFNQPRLSPTQATRQSQVTNGALSAFEQTKAAIEFLNTHLDELGGRPLDLAVESDAGLLAVEAVLQRLRISRA